MQDATPTSSLIQYYRPHLCRSIKRYLLQCPDLLDAARSNERIDSDVAEIANGFRCSTEKIYKMLNILVSA